MKKSIFLGFVATSLAAHVTTFAAPESSVNAPTLSIADQPVPRDLEARQSVPNPRLSVDFTDFDVFSLMIFEEPLVPTSAAKESAEERAAFVAMVNEVTSLTEAGRSSLPQMEAFLKQFPESRWRAALEFNLGSMKYDAGLFTGCITNFQSAYNLSKESKVAEPKRLADAALARWAEMLAKLGRVDETDALVKEGLGREPEGSSRSRIRTLSAAVAVMKNPKPGFAFKCGPFALASVRKVLGAEPIYTEAIQEAKSGREGFSLARVQEIAKASGMVAQTVQAGPEALATLPLPAIVHWKLDHYAAITERSADGRLYHLVDPTFEIDSWIPVESIAQEASGYYMVFSPAPSLPVVSAATASTTFGRGYPNDRPPNQQKDSDQQCPTPGDCPTAMAQWTIHSMSVSLHIEDTPIQYRHHVGPKPFVKVFYNEEASIQPANDNTTTFGNQWSHNWNSYVYITGTAVGGSAAVVLRGGGAESHILTATGTVGAASSAPNARGQSRLFYTGTANDIFRRELPDGNIERFNRSRVVTSAGTTRKFYYLTSVEDEAGNVVTVDYVTLQNRINRLVDELGNIVKFNYGSGANANRVTNIEDPFSRVATFAYSGTTTGAASRLGSITDPVGIVSSFGYSAGGKVDYMVTPSGTTSFVRGTGPSALDRWIEITHPAIPGDTTSQTERVEYRNNLEPYNAGSNPDGILPGNIYTTPSSAEEPPASIPVTNFGTTSFTMPAAVHRYNTQMTFHWDRKKWRAVQDWRIANGLTTQVDYDKATAYRWLRTTAGGFQISPTLSSIRQPLEYRVWFNYPGQASGDSEGSRNIPDKIARVVTATQTQITLVTTNTLGHPTLVTDPVGRRTRYTYESNDFDLNKIEVLVSGTSTYETTFQAYYPPLGTDHRPQWIQTASGTSGRVQFDWNGRGQVTAFENARGERTELSYTAGKLTEINPALAGTSDRTTLTYDSSQRVRTKTAWAFSSTYSYDNLDRLTTVTYPDATTETWNYQISGTGGQTLDIWKYKDRLNRETNYTYNGLRQVSKVTDPLNRETFLEWCRCGALQKLTDPKGQITDWVYDIQGRVVEKKIDGSTVKKLVYEPSRGILTTGTDALGQVKSYSYALDNRPTKIEYLNDGGVTPDVTLQWDPRYPRVTSMVDGVPGTTTYAYGPIGGNSANLLETENLAGADKIIDYTYDKVGRLFSRDIDSANLIEFYRDEIGRLRGTIATSGSVGYSYSATNGRLTSKVVAGNGQTLNIGYVDNDPSKPANLRKLLTTTGSTGVAQLDYAGINAMGRIGKITSSVSSIWSGTMEYDSADQLTRVNTTGTVAPADNHYSYDLAANVSEWRQVVSGSNTYYPYTKDNTNFTTKILKGTTSGTGSPYLTFTKDSNGNTTGWSDAISGKSETLVWDAENRLISVTQSPANKQFLMTYDGRSRLTIIEEKLSGVTQKTTRLVWSGMEICEERDGNTNAVLTKYYPDGELQWIAGTWVPIWYYRDHLGSVLETYSSSGVRQSQRRFDEWGTMTGSVPGPGVSKKGYTGHYQPEGLEYVMAPYRWYSPTTRGWLSRDPIGEAGGVNLYGYVSNNPTNLWDPYGLCSVYDLYIARTLTLALTTEGVLGLILVAGDIPRVMQAQENMQIGDVDYIVTPFSQFLSLLTGENIQLQITINPDGTPDPTYFWGWGVPESAFDNPNPRFMY